MASEGHSSPCFVELPAAPPDLLCGHGANLQELNYAFYLLLFSGAWERTATVGFCGGATKERQGFGAAEAKDTPPPPSHPGAPRELKAM